VTDADALTVLHALRRVDPDIRQEVIVHLLIREQRGGAPIRQLDHYVRRAAKWVASRQYAQGRVDTEGHQRECSLETVPHVMDKLGTPPEQVDRLLVAEALARVTATNWAGLWSVAASPATQRLQTHRARKQAHEEG